MFFLNFILGSIFVFLGIRDLKKGYNFINNEATDGGRRARIRYFWVGICSIVLGIIIILGKIKS